MVDKVFREMPPESRFTDADAEVIKKYSRELLSIGDKIVKVFYDTLFAHEPTASVFKPGERPAREKTLADWWIRTINGPFDRSYWEWQAYVGVIHFRRDVTNSMMIAMWAVILNLVQYELSKVLSKEELAMLMSSLHKLAATCVSLTVEGYVESYTTAIKEAIGADDDLMRNVIALMKDKVLGSVSRPVTL